MSYEYRLFMSCVTLIRSDRNTIQFVLHVWGLCMFMHADCILQASIINCIQLLPINLLLSKLLSVRAGSSDFTIMREPSTFIKVSNTSLLELGSQHRGVSSRSVSWNTTGNYLAMACSDRTTRLFNVDAAASIRDVATLSGHQEPVVVASFHPTESTLLCTAATDKSVRLWDVRGSLQRARINIKAGNAASSVAWGQDSLLAVVERDGHIYVYDTRKLTSEAGGVFTIEKPNATEICIFSPCGEYLIAGLSDHERNVGSLVVKKWSDNTVAPTYYPSHGPIFAMQISPDANYLATGGSDATVGVWDVADTMCCAYAISRPQKYIRGVAFSHDSKILATCTEDESIDLADALNGACIGSLVLGNKRMGGAEAIAWHPSEYLLACARISSGPSMPPSALTVAKLTIGSTQ
jgi:THO complex subunit 3